MLSSDRFRTAGTWVAATFLGVMLSIVAVAGPVAI